MEEKIYTLDGVYDKNGNKIDEKTVRKNADKMLNEALNGGGEYEGNTEKDNDNDFEVSDFNDYTINEEEDFEEEIDEGGEEYEGDYDEEVEVEEEIEEDVEEDVEDKKEEKEENEEEKESENKLTENEISGKDIVLYIDGEETTINGSKFIELAKLGLDFFVNKDKYDDLERIANKISNLGLTEKDVEVLGAFVRNPSKETLAGFLANFGIDIDDLSEMLIDTSEEDISTAKNYLNTQDPMKPFDDYYNSLDNLSKNKVVFLVNNIKGFREYLNAFVNANDLNGFKLALNTMLSVDTNKLMAKYKAKLLTMNSYDIGNLSNPRYFVGVMNEILSGLINNTNEVNNVVDNNNISINETIGGDMSSNIKKKKSLGNIKRRTVAENTSKKNKTFEEEVSELLNLDDESFADRLERARQRILKSNKIIDG